MQQPTKSAESADRSMNVTGGLLPIAL